MSSPCLIPKKLQEWISNVAIVALEEIIEVEQCNIEIEKICCFCSRSISMSWTSLCLTFFALSSSRIEAHQLRILFGGVSKKLNQQRPNRCFWKDSWAVPAVLCREVLGWSWMGCVAMPIFESKQHVSLYPVQSALHHMATCKGIASGRVLCPIVATFVFPGFQSKKCRCSWIPHQKHPATVVRKDSCSTHDTPSPKFIHLTARCPPTERVSILNSGSFLVRVGLKIL